MVADEQTQRLPFKTPRWRASPSSAATPARTLSRELTGHLKRVEHHYARLFEDAPKLDVEAGSLVFTGVVDDPET